MLKTTAKGLVRVCHLKLVILAIAFLPAACGDETVSVKSSEPPQALFLQDPQQEPYTTQENILLKIKNGSITITPVATYRIAGQVVSKRKYTHGWGAEVAPFDLAIVWGMLTYPHVQKYLVFKHDSTRMAYFRIKGSNPPVETDYAASHGSNNHIIPANTNIFNAVDRHVKVQARIILEGYLVNVEGHSAEQHISWKTSLSRTDTGRGACEIIYVTRLQVGNRVYE
ncbi:MAG: hypothetical protein N2572_02235 [Syntrophales bacterium]|nr:hypothetical protein [Syntrophales bacterium]